MDKKIERIITNYFDGQISDKEAKKLISWIEEGNRDIFNEYVILNFSAEQLRIAENNKNTVSWEKIASKINNRNSIKVVPIYKRNIFKYAAVVLIFVSTGYFFLTKDNLVNEVTPIIGDNNIEIGTDKAILTLGDGTDVILGKGETYIADNLESSGEDIIYKSTNKPNSEIAYNYLTVPRGGQYHVKLSDGTGVWLNSESRLKYPSEFLDNQDRIVELIYGEAYFDVSPSTNHNGVPFKVKHSTQEIEVLGTEFNVSAYRDELSVFTTLVEGEVSISNAGQKVILNPNEQSVISNDGKIMVSNVDVDFVIAWKKGVFGFRGKPLKEICKLLSRWYDVDVVIENKNFEDITFKGVIKKNNSIELILEALINSSDLNAYGIKDRTIYIK